MIKVTGIIYFPIWLTSGLLKKSWKWFVLNCKASVEEELSAQFLLWLAQVLCVRPQAGPFGHAHMENTRSLTSQNWNPVSDSQEIVSEMSPEGVICLLPKD